MTPELEKQIRQSEQAWEALRREELMDSKLVADFWREKWRLFDVIGARLLGVIAASAMLKYLLS